MRRRRSSARRAHRDAADARLEHAGAVRGRDGAEERRSAVVVLPGATGAPSSACAHDVHVARARERVDPAGDAAPARAVEQVLRASRARGTTTHGPCGAQALLDAVALVRRRRRVRGERADGERRTASSASSRRASHDPPEPEPGEQRRPRSGTRWPRRRAATVISRFFLSCDELRAEVLVDLLQLARPSAPGRTCRPSPRATSWSAAGCTAAPGSVLAAGDLLLDDGQRAGRPERDGRDAEARVLRALSTASCGSAWPRCCRRRR